MIQINNAPSLLNYSALQETGRDILSLLGQQQTNEVVWQPDPANEPQQLAYAMADKVDVLGYGGQAGGGKTDLGLGLGATKFYNSLFLRRVYPQLRRVIKRGNEIFPVRFVEGSKKSWTFNGREVTLASMQYADDWSNYQGWGSDLIVFDEAAEFLETQVRSLFGWLRTTRANQHTLMLLCFNPPTSADGDWIVRFFAPWIDPDYQGTRAEAGEIRWFVPDGDDFAEVDSSEPFERNGEMVRPHSRTFIPASRHDNPYLGEDYERTLDLLPEPLRSKVKYGDFSAGGDDDPWQVIPTQWVLDAQERWRNGTKPAIALRAVGVDVARGGKDRTSICKLYGNWFDEIITYPGRETPDGHEVARQVMKNLESNAPVHIDVVGVGSSPYDLLKVNPNLNITPVNSGSGSHATDKSNTLGFANLRAEMYWRLREALDPASGENIALPDDRELRYELTAPRYSMTGGKIKIEAKDDIKTRLGRSPDKADALALALHAASTGRLEVTI